MVGLRQIRRDPELNGTVRAWVGIVLGTLATMLLGAVLAVWAISNSWEGLAVGALVTLVLVACVLAIALRR